MGPSLGLFMMFSTMILYIYCSKFNDIRYPMGLLLVCLEVESDCCLILSRRPRAFRRIRPIPKKKKKMNYLEITVPHAKLSLRSIANTYYTNPQFHPYTTLHFTHPPKTLQQGTRKKYPNTHQKVSHHRRTTMELISPKYSLIKKEERDDKRRIPSKSNLKLNSFKVQITEEP